MLYPITADSLGSQPKVVECVPTTPFPDKGILTGVFDVLVVRDTIPLDFPVPEGVKLTARVTYCPGSSVIPCPIPEVMKPAPETAFC